MSEVQQALLSDDAKAKIDVWLAKYPADRRQSAIIPALHIAQEEHHGWLPENVIEAVADYVGIPHIAAFEVATFYSMYDLKPVGKHKIGVCTSISCMLRGSDELADHIKQRLDIDWDGTSSDGKFTLQEVECLGACRHAPAVLFDKAYLENVTPEDIDKIIAGEE
ncbi:MAG: NAD(P)H-dependent oxidoreductase subunit E [Legionellales bacterium]|nr:NAD(P)H-dependent oxidoreductase subunit E [Legionellales bacterium]|tara:strand:+ start:9471 stop:9965 length:495 start_codon:yes stop_codon:yes gene_type:complete